MAEPSALGVPAGAVSARTAVLDSTGPVVAAERCDDQQDRHRGDEQCAADGERATRPAAAQPVRPRAAAGRPEEEAARRVEERAQPLLPAGRCEPHLDVVVDAVEDVRGDDLALDEVERGAVGAVGVSRGRDRGGVRYADAGQALELLLAGEVEIERWRAITLRG